jgi:flagellar hook assembly protein FlgD
VPYYGRAWSTASPDQNAPTTSAAKYGSSVTALYETALELAATNGRRYDPVEGVAWTTYQKENCTETHGCVTSWRQLYYDDVQSLAAKYDLVNKYDIRGVGIWALGYDGDRPELYAVIKDKFITDTIPPAITASTVTAEAISPNGDGRQDATTIRLTVTGLTRYGWRVQPFIDGTAGTAIVEGIADGTAAEFTWDGRTADGAIARDGTYRITLWAADVSNNRSAMGHLVTVDSVVPVLAATTAPLTISPNGDRRFDVATLVMNSDELVHGRARVLDVAGIAVRTWKFADLAAGKWLWDSTDTDGKLVKDGAYTFRVDGIDAAGNGLVQQTPVLVDRTIVNITWARTSFKPGLDETNMIELKLLRAATVSVSIYRGKTLVRRALVDKPLPKGKWTWAWNGLNGHRELVEPGVYTATVTTTSWVGLSRLTRTVTVKAP